MNKWRDDFVHEFFNEEQWNNLADIEKNRFMNMYQNYTKLKEIGLNPTFPVFSLTTKRKVVSRKDSESESHSDSESDEEWKPSPEQRKDRLKKALKSSSRLNTTTDIKKALKSWPEFQPKLSVTKDDGNSTKAPLSASQQDVRHYWPSITLEPASRYDVKVGTYTPARRKSSSLQTCAPEVIGVEESPKKGERRYPRRSCSRKTYAEDESLNDDDFLFCDDCNQDYDGPCPLHPLVLVMNKEVPRDGSDLNRGKTSAPWPLSICFSKVEKAGLGVWTNANLPKGLLFGPYEGRVLNHVAQGEESGYGWRIRNKDYPGKCIDAVDSSISNWLRFVNCSRSYSETNIAAFQYKGQIYYKTITDINRGTELMVWYGDEYGEELGCKLEDTNQKSTSKVDDQTTKPTISTAKFATKPSLFRKVNLATRESSTEGQVTRNAYFLLPKLDTNDNLLTPQKNVKDLMSDITNISSTQLKSDNECSQCGKRFRGPSALRIHIRTHTGEKPHECPLCGKRFNQVGSLRRHILTHTDEKPHECSHCEKRFNQLSDLRRHILTHTGEKPHECSQCGKMFNQLGSLRTHILTHTGEKPHECSQCGKRFNRSEHLRRHILTHTGEKPHECSHCEKRFNQLCDLRRHILTHTGEKPHECSQCGKRFNQLGSLRTHILTHTGEKPHECSHCGKRFNQLGSLRTHILTHTGEKPHECSQCGKKFNDSSNLRTHIRTHTGEKPHECSQCGNRFTHKISLKRHILTHTGEEQKNK